LGCRGQGAGFRLGERPIGEPTTEGTHLRRGFGAQAEFTEGEGEEDLAPATPITPCRGDQPGGGLGRKEGKKGKELYPQMTPMGADNPGFRRRNSTGKSAKDTRLRYPFRSASGGGRWALLKPGSWVRVRNYVDIRLLII